MMKKAANFLLGLIALVIVAGVINIVMPSEMRIKVVELRLKPILRTGTPESEILSYLEKHNIRHGQVTKNLCGYSYNYREYNRYKAKGGTQPCKNVSYIYINIPTRFTPISGQVSYNLYLDQNGKLEFYTGRVSATFL